MKFGFNIYSKEKDGKKSFHIKSTTADKYKEYRTSVKHSDKHYDIDTKNPEVFRKSLHSALQEYDAKIILKPEEIKALYKMLGFGRALEEYEVQQIQKEKNEAVQASTQEQLRLMKEFPGRNEKEKKLSYDLTFIEGMKDRTVKVSLQQQRDKVLLSLQAFNSLKVQERLNALPAQTRLLKEEDIPNFIGNLLKNEGLQFRKNESLQVKSEHLLKKAADKNKDAIKAYNMYLDTKIRYYPPLYKH